MIDLPDSNPSKRPAGSAADAARESAEAWLVGRIPRHDRGMAIHTANELARDVVALTDERSVLADRVRELEEEIRIREQSQIPVIPRGAQRLIATLEVRVRELESALEVYADARHWAISRDEFRHPSAVWIGPGATDRIPDAPGVARAALAAGGRSPGAKLCDQECWTTGNCTGACADGEPSRREQEA